MTPSYLVRSSEGLSLKTGPPSLGSAAYLEYYKVPNNAYGFSPDGSTLMLYCQQGLISLSEEDYTKLFMFNLSSPSELYFSPKGTYLCYWGSLGALNRDTNPKTNNVHLYKMIGSEGCPEYVVTFSYKQKKNWKLNWSSDEHICARMSNDDVVFYEKDFKSIVHRIKGKVAGFSIAPGDAPYHIITYKCGAKGQPAVCKLYQYPNLNEDQALASKSLFQADKVDFYWNKTGTSALLMAITEVDKTGASYYGKQTLYFMTTNGTTNMINFNKEGPVHSVAWSPNGVEFCVIYGFLPASAALYNLKCEPVYEFPASAKNEIYYNPHGNILLLAGFGNICGKIEIWDLEKMKLINNCYSPDTNLLEWSPDGIYFITATTSPRLRIDNKYKIWHHSGTLLYEKKFSHGHELYSVQWKKYPQGTFPKPQIKYSLAGGIQNSEPQASAQAYRPPGARGRANVAQPAKVLSKATIKLKKKREAKKIKKLVIAEKEFENASKEIENKVVVENKKVTENMADSDAPATASRNNMLTGDPEKDKKLKQIKKKLAAIKQLKEQQAAGKQLEINQVAKIQTEYDLLQELENLQLK